LLIQVHGEVVGQVNGLSISSWAIQLWFTNSHYGALLPRRKGLINIDREVNMSGPTHDKGVFILQNWLSASFSNLAPLSLNASLVLSRI